MQSVGSKPLFSINNRNASKVTRSQKKHKILEPQPFEKIFHLSELMGEICSYLSTSNIYSIKSVNQFFNRNGNDIIETSFRIQLRAMKTLNMFYLQKYTEFWPINEIKVEDEQKETESLPKIRRINMGDILSYCTNAEKLIQVNNTHCLPIFFNKKLINKFLRCAILK